MLAKLVHRALARHAQPTSFPASNANLDALRHCSWLNNHARLALVESRISAEDLLRFQREIKYPRFYYVGERRIRYSLWHDVGVQLADLRRESVVLDVGAQAGLWGYMVRRKFGCRVLDLDIEYKPGVHGHRIGAPAGAVPLADSSLTHMVTFCAFNCFQGQSDSAMIREAARLLAPGGKLIIVPLCIGDQYVNLYDPQLMASADDFDAGAHIAAMPGWGNPFGRWYDQHAFESRILNHASAFNVEIHRITHPFLAHENFAAMYAARFIRKA